MLLFYLNRFYDSDMKYITAKKNAVCKIGDELSQILNLVIILLSIIYFPLQNPVSSKNKNKKQ